MFALFAVFAGVFWYGCLPQINGGRIGVGDSRARVIRLLGEPELVFTPEAPVGVDSYLTSYVFHRLDDKDDKEGTIQPRLLPSVQGEALWFPYASAGHLVYFEEGKVTAVYWGGT
jgi:hypothetical protein